MKKILVLAVASFIFASCNRVYDCKCSDPLTGEENQMSYQTNSKSHARRLCNDWETRVNTAITDKERVSCVLQ